MLYRVSWSDGQERDTEYDTYEAAQEAIRGRYPQAVMGHGGDIAEGGDETLAWPDEATAGEPGLGDGGQYACACIHVVEETPAYTCTRCGTCIDEREYRRWVPALCEQCADADAPTE